MTDTQIESLRETLQAARLRNQNRALIIEALEPNRQLRRMTASVKTALSVLRMDEHEHTSADRSLCKICLVQRVLSEAVSDFGLDDA